MQFYVIPTDSFVRLISLAFIVCSVLCASSRLLFYLLGPTSQRFGAGVAATVYSLFPENAVVLSIFGFFFSMPCFYYIVATPEYATTGRFVLLTYNLTCLYSYAKAILSICDRFLIHLQVQFTRS
jgi:hypothetical protein